MSKYTPWFPADVKPAHVGVYQRQYNDPPKPFYCYWDGECWMAWDRTPKAASRVRCESAFPKKPWRGLAEKPE